MSQEEKDCCHVFCYGSLRPDDDSGMPWTKEAVAWMRAQAATVHGAKLYMDTYAGLVFDDDDDKIGTDRKQQEASTSMVTGWVMTANPALFKVKLESFDKIENYKSDGSGLYQRAIVDVCLDDPGLMPYGWSSEGIPSDLGAVL